MRGVFHYADVSVCCMVLAGFVPDGRSRGSTDVLVIVNQVSWQSRNEVVISIFVGWSGNYRYAAWLLSRYAAWLLPRRCLAFAEMQLSFCKDSLKNLFFQPFPYFFT